MPLSDHDSKMRCQAQVQRALEIEASKRAACFTDEWIVEERQAMANAANQYALAHGLTLVTVDDIEQVEGLAVGHSDYAHKLSLYVAELVHGEREIRP